MRYSKNELLFLGVVVALLFFLGSWLYYEMNFRISAEGNEVVGKLILKRNRAERKYSDQVIWENMENAVPLYNRDTIRTGTSSEAILLLNDGTKIDLDAQTMVVLNIEKNNTNIGFKQGSVQVVGTGHETNLSISAGEQTIDVKGGGDLQISKDTDPKSEKLNLVVNSGKAEVQSSGGEKVEVEKNERASLSSGKDVQVSAIQVRTVSPSPGSRLILAQGENEIPFRWETNGSAPSLLEISKDPEFRVKSYSRVFRTRQAGVALPEGSYYWRVSMTVKSGEIERSASSRFTVISEKPVRLTSPLNRATIQYLDENPYVNFSWTQDELASSYRLEISGTPDFRNISETTESLTSSIARRMDEGTYYWRIIAKDRLTGNSRTSDVRSFSIQKKREIAVPERLKPDNNRIFYAATFTEEGVLFSWLSDREAENNILEISSSAQFPSSSTIRETGEGNSILIKRPLAAGDYYWRVISKTKEGNLSRPSDSGQFRITDHVQITLTHPVHRVTLTRSIADTSGVHFAWKGALPPQNNYRFVLARTASMQPPLRQTEISKGDVIIRDIAPGVYYWMVEIIDTDGQQKGKSLVEEFSIVEDMARPTALFPTRGTAVDMSSQNALPFRWSGPPSAEEYRFTLYQIKGGRRTEVFTKITRRTDIEITDLTLLDVGEFAWSVEAMRKGADGEITGPPTLTHFRIRLGEETAPKIISPETRYIEVERLDH